MNHYKMIKFLFWPLEAIVALLIVINGYFIFNTNYDSQWFYDYGMKLGIASFVCFTIALLSGMLVRYGIKSNLIPILYLYRREFGRLMFLFALNHYLTIKVFPMIYSQSTVTFPFYQVIGFVALFLSLFLFVTSNDWAVKKLGKVWQQLHQLVYVIVWLIFLHVAVAQGFSFLSALIFILAIVETMSLVNFHLTKLNLDK